MLTNRLSRIIQDDNDLRIVRSGASQINTPRKPRYTDIGDILRCESTLMDPAGQSKLRKNFGLGSGQFDPDTNIRAHHLIPWQWRDHTLVKKAAKGGFDFNDPYHNGTLLDITNHTQNKRPSHPQYNQAIKDILDDLNAEYPDLSSEGAANLLLNLSDTLRTIVKSRSHPLTDASPCFHYRQFSSKAVFDKPTIEYVLESCIQIPA